MSILKPAADILRQFRSQTKAELSELRNELSLTNPRRLELRTDIKGNPQYYLFMLLMMLGLLQLYICVNVTNGECIKEFLFKNGEPFSDMFMDYFNIVRYLKMDNIYTVSKNMYPPINQLFLLLFYGCIPAKDYYTNFESYKDFNYNAVLALRNTREAMWSYLAFTIIFLTLILFLVNKLLRKRNIKCVLLLDFIFVFSWGVIFCIDRGNILLPVIAAILAFFALEDSESRLAQEFGLICFAFAISMKVYPVFFSVYLINKKQYSKFVRLAIYSMIFFFVPFAFFGGFESLIAWIGAILSVPSEMGNQYPGSNYNAVNFLRVCGLIMETNMRNKIFAAVTSYLPLAIVVLGLIGSLFHKKVWKIVALCCLVSLLFPGTSATYNLSYMLIPCVLFIADKEKTGFDYVYSVLFFLVFTPFPYVVYDVGKNLSLYEGNNITVGFFTVNAALLTMFILLVGEAAVTAAGTKRVTLKGFTECAERFLLPVVCCFVVINAGGIVLSSVIPSDGQPSLETLRVEFEKMCDGGSGTRKDPLRISTAEQLTAFAELVNEGYSFRNEYIYQTKNIDMSGKDFTPIGVMGSGKYFSGVYDGGGHTVSNLTITGDQKLLSGNVGFFGMLAGKVFNLGIKDCDISGNCVGAVSSHSMGENAAIVNCWSSGRLSGIRAGGMTDNFNGYIINCFSVCELNAKDDAGLRSYLADGYNEVENGYILGSNINGFITIDHGTETVGMNFMQTGMCDKLNKWINNESDRYSDIIKGIKLCKWRNIYDGYPEFNTSPNGFQLV